MVTAMTTDRFKFRVWDGSSMFDLGELRAVFNSGDYGYTPPTQCVIAGGNPFGRHGFHAQKQDSVIEQCTGLRDSEGTLIYESDIVLTSMFSGYIVWVNQYLSWMVEVNEKKFPLAQGLLNKATVVGNRHEGITAIGE